MQKKAITKIRYHDKDDFRLQMFEKNQLCQNVPENDLGTFAERLIVYTKNLSGTLNELDIPFSVVYGNTEIKAIKGEYPLNQALLSKLRKIEFERIKIIDEKGGSYTLDFK